VPPRSNVGRPVDAKQWFLVSWLQDSDITKEDGVIRKSLASLAVAGALFVSQGASAQDHVVTRDEAAARLTAAETARQRDLSTVDRFLASPEAARAAGSVKADAGRLRAGLASLSDGELAQLAAQAASLDVAAGLDQDIRTLLIIFLIVAIVILVLQAVD
jgi:hypothetical protein